MIVSPNYCMSSFLMYRMIADQNHTFSKKICPNFADVDFRRHYIRNSEELYESLRRQVKAVTADKKAALALSGGVDSAILAKFMPKGSTAYTFRCVVRGGVKVIDETQRAAQYAAQCGMVHKIVEIGWQDFETYAPVLMRQKGAPIHSIEVQIYKAALTAKADGYETLLFGENADVIYGGFSGLLSRDWMFGEFIERFSYVMPYQVLREPELILEPYKKYEQKDGTCDVYRFLNDYYRRESLGSYMNACEAAGISFAAPFANTVLGVPLDLERIRAGEGKYFVREVFQSLYPGFNIPEKIPMPRPMEQWLKNWKGPMRPEFYPYCTKNLTGDQKWMVLALEWFLKEM
ncbi:MAG: asparagine synthase [Eubacterium sp.]|nr:asparagine synthase [Eubacterium sp.]